MEVRFLRLYCLLIFIVYTPLLFSKYQYHHDTYFHAHRLFTKHSTSSLCSLFGSGNDIAFFPGPYMSAQIGRPFSALINCLIFNISISPIFLLAIKLACTVVILFSFLLASQIFFKTSTILNPFSSFLVFFVQPGTLYLVNGMYFEYTLSFYFAVISFYFFVSDRKSKTWLCKFLKVKDDRYILSVIFLIASLLLYQPFSIYFLALSFYYYLYTYLIKPSFSSNDSCLNDYLVILKSFAIFLVALLLSMISSICLKPFILSGGLEIKMPSPYTTSFDNYNNAITPLREYLQNIQFFTSPPLLFNVSFCAVFILLIIVVSIKKFKIACVGYFVRLIFLAIPLVYMSLPLASNRSVFFLYRSTSALNAFLLGAIILYVSYLLDKLRLSLNLHKLSFSPNLIILLIPILFSFLFSNSFTSYISSSFNLLDKWASDVHESSSSVSNPFPPSPFLSSFVTPTDEFYVPTAATPSKYIAACLHLYRSSDDSEKAQAYRLRSCNHSMLETNLPISAQFWKQLSN